MIKEPTIAIESFNKVRDQMHQIQEEVKALEEERNDLYVRLENWDVNIIKKFELLPTDEIVSVPSYFVIKFMRDGELWVSMDFIGEGIKQFKEEILRQS